jgi:hypothetical protein
MMTMDVDFVAGLKLPVGFEMNFSRSERGFGEPARPTTGRTVVYTLAEP